MFKLNYDEIADKIVNEKGISKAEIEVKVDDKLKSLSGLISREGAIHIIANELGVGVFYDLGKKRFKVSELRAGMRSIEVLAKVIKIYGVREFKTEKREGRVGNILVGDETGVLRMVCWDESCIDKLGSVKDNDILKIMNCYARDNNGYLEIHLGNGGDYEINPGGESVGQVSSDSSFKEKLVRLGDLKENEVVSVFGTIVQVFEPKFYEACSECNKKLNPVGECSVHGKVAPRSVPIVNAFFDDGSGNVRVVGFREIGGKLLGMGEDELAGLKDNASAFENARKNIMGSQFVIRGKVIKNEMFDRLELIANEVREAKPEDIIPLLK